MYYHIIEKSQNNLFSITFAWDIKFSLNIWKLLEIFGVRKNKVLHNLRQLQYEIYI